MESSGLNRLQWIKYHIYHLFKNYKSAAIIAFTLASLLLFILIQRPGGEKTQLIGNKSKTTMIFNDNDPHLLFSNDQYDIDRRKIMNAIKQSYNHQSYPIPSSSSFSNNANSKLAQEALDSVQILKSFNLTFTLIVFGWRRRKSLDRLCQSLLNADYLGFPVEFEFHLEGESHPLVVEYANKFKWPHGPFTIVTSPQRIGLRQIVLDSWKPTTEKQFAMFFEDDIEVAPSYFKYILLVLKNYVFDSNGHRINTNKIHQHLVGISLNTPRFHETGLVPSDWTPQSIIGATSQFLFQLPSSWGALYFPWIWREFLAYYSWREKNLIDLDIIPLSSVNKWERSWKRFLIELIYMKGYVMIYPNLPRQHSFSTHHREPGEHTRAEAEDNLVDDLGTQILDYFTVPLVREKFMIDKLFADMQPLQHLPIINFHHKLADNFQELKQFGLYTLEALSLSNLLEDRCILDHLSKSMPANENEEKYLIYAPQHGASKQFLELQVALKLSKMLKRTLIFPQFWWMEKEKTSPLDNLFNITSFMKIVENGQENQWTTIKLWGQIAPDTVWIDRLVDQRPWQLVYRQSKDPLQKPSLGFFKEQGITPLREIVIPTIPNDEKDISRYYGKCNDKYLAFKNLWGMVPTFQKSNDTLNRSFYEWFYGKIEFTKSLQTFRLARKNQLPKSFACMEYVRGDVPELCESFPIHDNDTVKFQNCKANVNRTINYLWELASAKGMERGIRIDQILFIYPQSEPFYPPMTVRRPLDGKPIYFATTSWMVKSAVEMWKKFPKELHNNMGEVAALTEDWMCTNDAVFFLGNKYSWRGRMIYEARRAMGKPAALLGVADKDDNKMLY